MDSDKRFVLRFDEIGIDDVPLVGGKNASLGEMYCNLTKKGVSIPNGFATTSDAYRYFMQESGLMEKIRNILGKVDVNKSGSLKNAGEKIRGLILKASFPKDLEEEIVKHYQELCKEYGKDTDVAVRSSATAEDLPDASFAGQQETYLNVRGPKQIIDACRKSFASLFTDRAIFYRETRGFDHFSVALSAGIQKMVRSDKASSGVMFSLDTDSGFRDVVLINAAYGLGEYVVQGMVNPDTYYVFKGTLDKYRPIIQKRLGEKKIKAVYAKRGGIKNLTTQREERESFCLSNDEILKLSKWAVIIEDHYSNKRGKSTPMDMEWAKDGVSGKLFIVQARPETVHSTKNQNLLNKYHLKEKGNVLTSGYGIGDKIATGKAKIIKSPKDIGKFKKGDILVTEITDPDWVPVMKKASAIITNSGGKTSHAAIVSRELGVPAIVGTNNATSKIKMGEKVTVSCAEGSTGFVYKGELDFGVKKVSLKNIPETKTKIMMNVGSPERAFYSAQIPSDGVGLAREEFIIGNYVKIHPLALLNYDDISKKHPRIKKAIDNLTVGYIDKKQFFVDKMAEGISMIASAFYPNDVIVRLSDFKSNEYANLIGGSLYEPEEENPMLGWRGASRYYNEKYRGAFALECIAIKKARDEFGLKNIKVMVPMCRTPEEGKKVLRVMRDYGLKRGKNGIDVYVMCELPSNVMDIDRFAKVFDGFSIGSNDLTQMTLGVDRDSSLISNLSKETNPAVKEMIKLAIKGARRNKKKVGICGEAPSNYPEIVKLLVENKIDSISLEPDSVLKVRKQVAKLENKKKSKKRKRIKASH